MIDSEKVITVFNKLFTEQYNTKLIGGASEPFYRASLNSDEFNLIYFRDNIVSSALHEISHWCISGEKRRSLDDYGYWYCPENRNHAEQLKFYKHEIKPQALEKCFSETLNLVFKVSLDNLSIDLNTIKEETDIFIERVNLQCVSYKEKLPKRAQLFNEELKKYV